MDVIVWVVLVAGICAGFAAGLLVASTRGMSAGALDARDERLLDLADSRFREAGVRASGELEARRQAVDHLVAPLRDTLARVEGQLRELERARLTAYTALTEQVGFVQATSEQLRAETAALVGALRAPQARGRWGEMQLRRVVELAGMLEHCDFEEQVSGVDASGAAVRPDLVVQLAGGKRVVVDAKVSLAAYLEAAEAVDGTVRVERLVAHARHLRGHVERLAAKEYWRAFQPSPELVVLFVPGEAFLAPALERDPTLLEDAMRARVVIATPTTLVTMLRTVALTWQQEALTSHTQEVFELGQELHARLGTLGSHMDKLGGALRRAVEDYNRSVGSLERSVLVPARRLATLRVTSAELSSPRTIEEAVRPLGAVELLDDQRDDQRDDRREPGDAMDRRAS